MSDVHGPTAAPPRKAHLFGTHRTRAPEQTLQAVQPLAREMGITRIAVITGLDVIGIPVVTAMRPNSRSIAVAQGKGLDLVSAKVSGLMEAIENYHAERPRLPLSLASYREMQNRGPVIDVNSIPRSAGGSFDPHARILWVEGHDALRRLRISLPFELVHTDYTAPLPTGSGAFLMSDSGVASGNDPLEATSHAICELIERDAITLWRFSRPEHRRATRIVLDSIEDEACRLLLGRFERAGVKVAVWEVTSDIEVPSFHALIVDGMADRWRPIAPAWGAGCHPSRSIAMSRALSEAAQTRLTVIAGTRDDIGLAAYRRGSNDDSHRDAYALIAEPEQRRFSEGPTFEASSFNEDLSYELRCLGAAGVEETAIVDLTLPEFRIPVVRVVIPGLEAMYDAAGFTGGRRLRSKLQ